MSLFKSPFELLTEACKAEDAELCDANIDDIEQDLDDTFGDIEELDDDDELSYTVEMVNVIEQKTSTGCRYLVEMDNLAKYMMSANITDVSEAVSNIAESNSLEVDTMCVVIESEDYLLSLLQEARKAKGPASTRAKHIKADLEVINMVKTKGLKVLKKKSRTRRRKKK